MTGFAFATFLVHHTKMPEKPESFHPSSISTEIFYLFQCCGRYCDANEIKNKKYNPVVRVLRALARTIGRFLADICAVRYFNYKS